MLFVVSNLRNKFDVFNETLILINVSLHIKRSYKIMRVMT